ncbi:hypothetical protein ACOT81_35975 [Streptomyces sp. WI04-05B]|uniref:hypothetical protein n=1 Tax=Streptomyces TaxID=1883 RepID=UPI0029A4C9A3|nr:MULTISPECIES: hypothetical protein [unclassified Streptomyces]MDX2548590.1 hypothetical protein [Streptomyces sp. WI04-05B]MDX2588078.1 hypothetical protein [Streptomyces sp. WI04-05A]MDX3751738.1 hypothetical protein [Streptomyces sp. AK08-02]
MYVLIVPVALPFVLLATVMGLSWWEDRILPVPPAEPAEAPAEAPFAPVAPVQPAELARVGTR